MFCDRLKKIRTQSGLSQLDLAKKLFVTQQAVARWESNKNTPNPETLIKISEILNVSVDYLVGRIDQEKKPTPVSEDGPDPDEELLMNLVGKLTPDQQSFLLAWLKTALSQEP